MKRITLLLWCIIFGVLALNYEISNKPLFLSFNSRDIVGVPAIEAAGMILPEGINGKNQVVAIADSGLDKGSLSDLHPDFKTKQGSKPKILNILSWADGSVADNNGHGTHMAGIIAGTGAASNGKFKGIAPESSIYVQSVMSIEGRIQLPRDLSSLYNPSYSAGARIQVNGWGTPGNYYNEYARQTDWFMMLRPDFLAIFGAGNSGPKQGTLTSEANSKNALVVGASVDDDQKSILNSESADFSSRGPTADGRIKPDLLAPGSSITSVASQVSDCEKDLSGLYTTKQGTSMAAAVTGGAAALLRQYFVDKRKINPSSALLKAALINGARSLYETDSSHKTILQNSQQSFGILDVGRTLLGLHENSYKFVDFNDGIAQGDTLRFSVTTWTTISPIKVTLVWTDPPNDTGELLNDIDLKVIAPNGAQYKGNSHFGAIVSDTKNNVEQVIIPHPVSGTYEIEITGKKILTTSQPFAIVMGQPIIESRKSKIASFLKPINWIVNEKENHELKAAPEEVNLLIGPNKSYGVLRLFREESIDIIKRMGKNYVEILSGPESQYIELDVKAEIIINGKTSAQWPKSARGATAILWFSPLEQKVIRVEASYQEIEGIFIEGDLHDGWLKLLNNPYRYKLSDSVKIEFENQILGSNTTPSPLIVSKKPLEILPGNTIRLVIDPGSLEVSLIQIIRTVVQGIAKSELNDQGIQIEGFGLLKLMEGIRVNRAGKEPNLSDVKIGDFVQAVYLPKEKKAAYLWATDQSVWGKVIYVSSKERLIYFVDQFQRVYRKKLQSDAIISRWGMHVELAAISPGDWGWFSFGTEGMLEAIKIWETSGQEYRTISQISHDYAEIETKEGEKYKTFNLTAVNKTGLPVPVSEILPGDQVELIPLDLSMELGIKGNILASISASSNPVEEKQNSINLTHSTILMGERIFILGRTNASVVYIYPNSGNEWYEVNVKEDGRFVWWSDKRAQDTGYQLVAVNANKKMYGNYIEVPAGLNVTFEDIRGHKTESIIRNYAQKGIITGFPDNTYKPEKPISLQELALIISKALGWTVCSIQGEREASQLGVAPWAITAYGSMFDRKLHEIFNQNPTWLVSRENIVVLAEKFLQAEKIPKENWPNWKKEFFSQGSFDEPIKRAEAIILIDATLQKLDYFRNLDK